MMILSSTVFSQNIYLRGEESRVITMAAAMEDYIQKNNLDGQIIIQEILLVGKDGKEVFINNNEGKFIGRVFVSNEMQTKLKNRYSDISVDEILHKYCVDQLLVIKTALKTLKPKKEISDLGVKVDKPYFDTSLPSEFPESLNNNNELLERKETLTGNLYIDARQHQYQEDQTMFEVKEKWAPFLLFKQVRMSKGLSVAVDLTGLVGGYFLYKHLTKPDTDFGSGYGPGTTPVTPASPGGGYSPGGG